MDVLEQMFCSAFFGGKMSSNICFKQDILNVLRAAYIASQGSARVMARAMERCSAQDVPSDEILGAYNTGFATALAAVGVAFGLDRSDDRTAQKPNLPDRDPRELPGAGPDSSQANEAELIAFLWEAAGSVTR
jgi:hypothetical protein